MDNILYRLLVCLSFFALSAPSAYAQGPIQKSLKKYKRIFKDLREAQTHDSHFEAVEALQNTNLTELTNIQAQNFECSELAAELSSGPIGLLRHPRSAQSKKTYNCLNHLVEIERSFINQSSARLQRKINHPDYRPLICGQDSANTKTSRQTFGPTKPYVIDSTKTHGPLFGRELNNCEINFTFDDGPDASLTHKLLDILESQNVLANFFVVGKRVAAQPDIVLNTAIMGHNIGNHTETHRNLRTLSTSKGIQDIELGFERIFKAIGLEVAFFRFPYGASTPELRSYLAQTARTEFFWNMDTLDWKIKDPEALFDYVIEQIRKNQRGIILFHDIQPQTIAIMPILLETLRLGGFQPVLFKPLVKNDKVAADNSSHQH